MDNLKPPTKTSNSNKIRIKAFPMTLDDDYISKIWDVLESAIREIQKKNNSGLSFEELYRNAYTLVLHKQGEKLYIGMKKVVTQHLLREVRSKILNSLHNNFLHCINSSWVDHQFSMIMIRDILMYMDRVYVKQNNLTNVYDQGLILFRDLVIHHQPIRDHLTGVLLNMIKQERSGEIIERTLVSNMCKMLIMLGVNSPEVYQLDFENHFIRESAEFYKLEGLKFLEENCSIIYIKQVESRLNEERIRAQHYLDSSSEILIIRVVEEELISCHMQSIVEMENSGMVHMLANEKYDDLACMYHLFCRVANGLKTMVDCMSNYLKHTGKALVTDPEISYQPIIYIKGLLDLKKRFDFFLIRSFNNDPLFKHAIHSDFENFININERSSEYLSLYIDNCLRNGAKTMTENEMEQELDQIIVIFKFMQEKDVFERYYKQHLAKRLLLNKSISDDAEKSLISKFKNECGGQFTSKLEGMFKDISVSNSTMEKFKHYLQIRFDNQLPDIDLYVRVLTTGYWPSLSNTDICNIPLIAKIAFETFSDYYLTNHSGRKLTLQPNLGFADINAIFYGNKQGDKRDYIEKKHVLQVSTYQMCILYLFNKHYKISCDEMHQETNISVKDLQKALHSLACGKISQRILIKIPNNNSIDNFDSFSINDEFNSKLIRVKVQTAILKSDNETERKASRQKVEEDRKHEIEAALVRIMKARKKLGHTQLVSECINQLKSRFSPSPILIKKRIESLIEREYIARSFEDRKFYNYLA